MKIRMNELFIEFNLDESFLDTFFNLMEKQVGSINSGFYVLSER